MSAAFTNFMHRSVEPAIGLAFWSHASCRRQPPWSDNSTEDSSTLLLRRNRDRCTLCSGWAGTLYGRAVVDASTAAQTARCCCDKADCAPATRLAIRRCC